MKCIKILVPVAILLLLVGCASKKEPEAKELKGTVKTQVLEHKGTALAINELPIWVETYIQKGIPALEKMPDFTEDYCFVAEESGSNLNAVQAWVEGFNMPQLIARNISTRVEATFSGAASGSTDGAYGTYFEDVVKACSDITYSGARKQNDWWVLVRRFDEKTSKKYVDEYRSYILYTIEKDLLDIQVLDVIEDTAKASDLTEDQNAAVNKVKQLVQSEGLSVKPFDVSL